MNRSKRLADLMNLIMFTFAVSMAGLFLIDAITGKDAGITLLACGNFLILLYVYFLRTKIRKMPVFAVLHVLLFLLCAVAVLIVNRMAPVLLSAGADAETISACPMLWIVLSACLTLADVVFWMSAVQEEKNLPVSESGEAIPGFRPVYKEGLPYLPLLFVAIFVLGIAYSAYAYKEYYGKAAYTLGVLFIGLYFLRKYFSQMGELVKQMHRETGMHRKRIVSANAKLALPFIAFSFVLMFLLQSDFLIDLFERILLFVMKWTGWFVFTAWIIVLSFFGSLTEGSAPMAKGRLYMPADETPEWMRSFDRIIEQVLTVLFFGLVLFIIVRAILFFIRKFSERSVNTVRREDFPDMTETRERLKRSERRGREKKERLSGTNAEKIRKLYRRFVRKQVRNGLTVEKQETPLELVPKLAEATGLGENTLVDITTLYDTARYGGTEISNGDVSGMEKLL